jgi:hypothetical protein
MFNENFAKKVQTCRLPFPETWSLNSLMFTFLRQNFINSVYKINQSFKYFDTQSQVCSNIY